MRVLSFDFKAGHDSYCIDVYPVGKASYNGFASTDSETVRDIVYQATGFDMDVVRKEDLHKEMRDKSLSAMSFYSNDSQPDEAQQPTEVSSVNQT